MLKYLSLPQAAPFEEQTQASAKASAKRSSDPADVVARFRAAATEEQKLSIAETWLQEFTSLSEILSMATRKDRDARKKMVNLIFSDDISIERCQLFAQLFTARSPGHIPPMLCFLQESLPEEHSTYDAFPTSYNFRPIPISELKVIVAILQACGTRGSIDMMHRLARIKKIQDFEHDFELEKTQISGDHLNFFRRFGLYIWESYHNKEYFSDGLMIKFFKVMQMPVENFRSIWNLREIMSEKYYEFFIITILNRYSVEDLDMLCASDQAVLLSAMPYLVLISGLEGIADLQQQLTTPVIQQFIQIFRALELLMKEYSAPAFPTVRDPKDPAKFLSDYSWDIQTLNVMFQCLRNDTSLLSATSQLIVSSKGAALETLKHCLVPTNDRKFRVLEAMVFDYPLYCTELQNCHCTLGEQRSEGYVIDLEEDFVTFSGYANAEVAKIVLHHPIIARLYLLTEGLSSQQFNVLYEEGVFDVLLAADEQNLSALSCLTTEPHHEEMDDNYFFGIKALVYAHKKEFRAGQTLLEAILNTDPMRFGLLNRCINIFEGSYSDSSDALDIDSLCIKISDDLIASELMECILVLPPPAMIPGEFPPGEMVGCFIDDWLPGVSQYPTMMQLVAMKMMLKVLDTPVGIEAFTLIMSGGKNNTLDNALDFIVLQFNLYIEQVRGSFSAVGRCSASKDDRVLRYLLAEPEKTQRGFEEQISEVLKLLSIDEDGLNAGQYLH